MSALHQDRYAELFRVEAREHLAELDATLLAFERDTDHSHIADMFRNTHTIKGMAAAMGYQAVERIAHAIEALLDDIRNGAAMSHKEVVALLFDSTGVLHQCVSAAMDGQDNGDHAGLLAMVARLESYRHRDTTPARTAIDTRAAYLTDDDALLAMVQGLRAMSDGASSSGDFPAQTPVSASYNASENGAVEASSAVDAPIVCIAIRLTADCPLKGVRGMLVMARLESVVRISEVHPPQSAWSEETFDGAFTVIGKTNATAGRLDAVIRAVGDIAHVNIGAVAPRVRSTQAAADRTVRVDRKRLDTLLDLVGELVVTRDRLMALADENDHSSTRALTRTAYQTARLISALQEEVLQTRMVPVGQVFDRFPRLVRDIAKELGKDVEFVTEGHEIELDRALVDALSDPLMHLLRNALDHGVESADERRLRRKPPTSRLVVRAARDRAAVVIQVEDDGKGVDRQAILSRAHESGLVDRSVTTIDDDALLQILAHPGLSTAKKVTTLSGRGVGVDVVATSVRALGGVLEMETIANVGSVFTLRLPVSLAIARALLVKVGDETYAFPAAHVLEVLEFDPSLVATFEGRESLSLRDELLPIVPLRRKFGYPPQSDESFVAVVEASGRRTALLVDSLISQQDIVVKPYDAVRGSSPWFTGATVRGDGTPALIVDLGSLT